MIFYDVTNYQSVTNAWTFHALVLFVGHAKLSKLEKT